MMRSSVAPGKGFDSSIAVSLSAHRQIPPACIISTTVAGHKSVRIRLMFFNKRQQPSGRQLLGELGTDSNVFYLPVYRPNRVRS